MKFYDFSDYEYYALIAVSEHEEYPMDAAMDFYETYIGEFDEYEKEIAPNEISKYKAYKSYRKACKNEFKCVLDMIKAFQKTINIRDEKCSLVLVDGSLF